MGYFTKSTKSYSKDKKTLQTSETDGYHWKISLLTCFRTLPVA